MVSRVRATRLNRQSSPNIDGGLNLDVRGSKIPARRLHHPGFRAAVQDKLLDRIASSLSVLRPHLSLKVGEAENLDDPIHGAAPNGRRTRPQRSPDQQWYVRHWESPQC